MSALLATVKQYWGYDSLRPLQAEAMAAVREGRDSVVVLPTGGGKSLCFQAPALMLPGLAVVVSPLISLMKDQVDALTELGVPAACVNSTLGPAEKRLVAEQVRSGHLKLLYLSPERLMTEKTLQFLKGVPISFFAIDEAHCISDWGHDFRPEYRMLSRLKELFPKVAVHGYTATATERVRQDIARELRLKEPEILVGSFDRPNLIYRVQRRGDLMTQIGEVLARHPNEAGIIYCIRRADVDELCAEFRARGVAALPYHAGLSDDMRKRHQEAFIQERARIIVATVAFGMGIDKSNVRFVIHAAAPKSLEHYQQESGRAGRDGLEADCTLLYSPGDFSTWRRIQSELPEEALAIARKALDGIEAFCSGLECRRQAILNHFGQSLKAENCQTCDVCLGELEPLADAKTVTQKILSCVLRLKEGFGGDYTAQVLIGSKGDRILSNRHDQLSTYGLLSEHKRPTVRGWIEQLARQGFLAKEGEFNLLKVTDSGRQALKGEVVPRLLAPADKPRRSARIEQVSWEGVERGLFEALRVLRRERAEARRVSSFVIFSDATLREMARRRPSSLAALAQVPGVGEKKLAEYGKDFLNRIVDYCREHQVALDAGGPTVFQPVSADGGSNSLAKRRAFEMFREGRSVEEVMVAVDRARSTTAEYLSEFLAREGIVDSSPWLEPTVFETIRAATATVGHQALKPVFDAMGGQVTYEQIKIALTCLRNSGEGQPAVSSMK